MNKKEIDALMYEALDNIRDDRKLAREFLNEIANLIATDSEHNRHLSPVAAKHIETMQRSNEQLVKLINLRQKRQAEPVELSENDKDNLFDMIQGTADDG
jgi:phage shock protein A